MSQSIKPLLLVEDNPMDVDLTLRAFSKHGFAHPIVVARDGEEAVALIPRWKSGETLPFVILLDINLPKINGIEVLQAYRMHEITRQIPVILLYGSEEDQKIRRLSQFGEMPYLTKPIKVEEFQQLIREIGIADGRGD
ncbi:MAG: response regulator [Anaerolineales bacterium]|nr:response regulator [Anaerolineales bacterium]